MKTSRGRRERVATNTALIAAPARNYERIACACSSSSTQAHRAGVIGRPEFVPAPQGRQYAPSSAQGPSATSPMPS